MEGKRTRAAAPKREQGLKKKAAELATLCGVDVCILGRGPHGELFFWPDDVGEVRRIAQRYLDSVGGTGGGATGKKRKRAEAAVGDLPAGGRVEPKEVLVGSPAVDTWIHADDDDDLAYMLCSPPPMVRLDDFFESLPMIGCGRLT